MQRWHGFANLLWAIHFSVAGKIHKMQGRGLRRGHLPFLFKYKGKTVRIMIQFGYFSE